MIQDVRLRKLNKQGETSGKYIIYWMQASQRTSCNHALEYAIRRANQDRLPLVVFFQMVDDYPEANRRHYRFMLEGLSTLVDELKNRGVEVVVSPAWDANYPALTDIARDASIVVVDCGYLRYQREWRRRVAGQLDCPLIQIETDVVVPVEAAAPREAYSAYLLRKKLLPQLELYLQPLSESEVKVRWESGHWPSLALDDIDYVLDDMNIDQEVAAITQFRGGTGEARVRLRRFMETGLPDYESDRNDPGRRVTSELSPYLHFGQISPLEIALQVRKRQPESAVKVFLEELIVRRELAINFVYYNHQYDSYSGLPAWSQKTLDESSSEREGERYSLEDFRNARTHDSYWNAAQQELVRRGKMHGYMRMYWGKKILEWSVSPQEAFGIALYLNNRYEIDGRDPNGYAGVAWCFGKHDRPWPRKPVFGTVRSMTAAGLKRKFDMQAYVAYVSKELAPSDGRV